MIWLRSYSIAVVLLLAACGYSKSKGNDSNTSTEVVPTESSKAMYTKMVDNSAHSYYGRPNHVDSIVSYTEGIKDWVRVFKQDSLSHTKYLSPDGKVVAVHFAKDSLIVSDGSSDLCTTLFYDYDSNGHVTLKGCQGLYNGAGVPVGTWYYFHEDKLVRTVCFHNDVLGKDYMRHTMYAPDGSTRVITTNNFMLYETDSVVISTDILRK